MTPTALFLLLRCAGWATLIAYVIRAISNTLLKMDRISQSNVPENLTTEVAGVLFFGAILDVPINVGVGVLCLAAAHYLIKKPKTIAEVFE